MRLKGSLIQQNWSVTTPRILTKKINQGTKFGRLEKPMFGCFDVIIFSFNGRTKYLGHDLQWTISEIIASLEKSPPFGAKKEIIAPAISIGSSMICSDSWHKYHKFMPNITYKSCYYLFILLAKYHVQIILLFVYTTSRKRVVIFTCRYFKLSWNTSALSQSNRRNFSCSSIIRGNRVFAVVCYNGWQGWA